MSAQKNLAFIGLGLMGLPMASHLVRGGHHVSVWNRSQPSIDKLLEETKSFSGSVKVASSATEAANGAECVITMLFDGKATLDAIKEMNLKDKTVVMMSTISLNDSQEASKLIQSQGGKYIEAPVLGNRKVARDAKLQVLAGANDSSLIEHWKDVLSLFGVVRNLGGVGKAMMAKLAVNQMIAANLVAWANTYALISEGGVNEEEFMKVIANGPVNLPYFHVWSQKMKSHDYNEKLFSGFGVQKDVSLISQAAEQLGLDTGFLDGMKHIIDSAVAKGHGEHDFSSVYEGVLKKQ
jgi:3-hydroxyisobutyrate dehydrogenase